MFTKCEVFIYFGSTFSKTDGCVSGFFLIGWFLFILFVACVLGSTLDTFEPNLAFCTRCLRLIGHLAFSFFDLQKPKTLSWPSSLVGPFSPNAEPGSRITLI